MTPSASCVLGQRSVRRPFGARRGTRGCLGIKANAELHWRLLNGVRNRATVRVCVVYEVPLDACVGRWGAPYGRGSGGGSNASEGPATQFVCRARGTDRVRESHALGPLYSQNFFCSLQVRGGAFVANAPTIADRQSLYAYQQRTAARAHTPIAAGSRPQGSSSTLIVMLRHDRFFSVHAPLLR